MHWLSKYPIRCTQVSVDEDGNVVLPDGKNLNPHDRQHWEVIQTILGAEYEYDADDTKVGGVRPIRVQ